MFGHWKPLVDIHSEFSRELSKFSPNAVTSDPSKFVTLLVDFAKRFENPASDAVSDYVFSQPLLRKKMSESDGLFRRFSQDCLFEGLNIVYVLFLSLPSLHVSLSYTHTHKTQQQTDHSLRDPCNAHHDTFSLSRIL